MIKSHQIREWAAVGVLAGGLALCGCGSGDDPAASPTPAGAAAKAATPEASVAAPEGMRGSWKRTMKPRDWRPAGRGYPLGTWRFDVDPSGAVNVYLPRTTAVDFTTQFVVKDDDVTIDSIPVCTGQTMHYTWHASGGELTLTVVDDDGCAAGAALFGGTWTRRR